jgi:hypothetical protein
MKTLGLTLLVICTVRFASAITGGIVGWASWPQSSRSYRVGESLQTFGGFGDGEGVLLLVAELFILLWLGRHAIRWTSPWTWAPAPPRAFAIWTEVLLGLTSVGAVVVLVGTILDYDGGSSTRAEWGVYLSSGGFELAYALASVGGIVALRHLTRSWQEPQAFRPDHMG